MRDGKVILLMGPTACGKTDAACFLAEHFPCDIISVDSALVYRELDIGTAKPPPYQLARYPHQLIDIRDADGSYSAAQFRLDALAAIEHAHANQRIPLLVGGTGLYFRILRQGIAALPQSNPEVRAALEQRRESEGLAALHEQLRQVDAASAARIHPRDPQRILRALEVFETSGESLSALQARSRGEPFPFTGLSLVLAPNDRAWLHRRIERRFDAMLVQGFINEVSALREKYALTLEHAAMRAVGYRAVWAYLNGDYDRAQLRERGVIDTRQLAKRQYTWFRSVDGARWLDPSAANCHDKLLRLVDEYLA